VRLLQASELAYAKQIAQEHSGGPIQGSVIIIPPHFGPAQRRALQDAAELAGIQLLSLVHSHSAAALQYGIERDFTDKTEQIILYDVASSDVVAALVEYSSYPVRGSKRNLSQFLVKDVTWGLNAGANELDVVLLRHFASQVWRL
jgi:hypoxia up-regulated 1